MMIRVILLSVCSGSKKRRDGVRGGDDGAPVVVVVEVEVEVVLLYSRGGDDGAPGRRQVVKD